MTIDDYPKETMKMDISGTESAVFTLSAQGYQVTEVLGTGFEADCLNANISVRSASLSFDKALKFLMVEELEQLRKWLVLVDDIKDGLSEFTFLDPDIKCVLLEKNGIKRINWEIKGNDDEYNVVEMLLIKENVENCKIQLNSILEQYPCRCGGGHMTWVEFKDKYQYSLCYEAHPDPINLGLKSREFRIDYKDGEQMTAANLYFWLHQTKKVLWDVDIRMNRITFFTGPITLLGTRLATLVGADQDRGEGIMMELVNLLSRKEMKLLERETGKRLCDHRQLYNLVFKELKDPDQIKFFKRFVKMFVEI